MFRFSKAGVQTEDSGVETLNGVIIEVGRMLIHLLTLNASQTSLSFSFFDIFVAYAITVVPFLPLHSTPSCPHPHSHISPLQFMSMSHTYKFFGFYISYIILTLPLTFFHLSSMLLILCTFPLLSPSHSPIDNPPCDLHLYGSVPVLVVCLVCFCFCFRCGC